MRKRSGRGTVLSALFIAAGLFLIALAAIKMYSMPDVIQYIIPAPPLAAPSPAGVDTPPPRNAALASVIEALDELRNEVDLVVAYADLSGVKHSVLIESDAGYQKDGALNAVGAGYFALYHHPLLMGRYFYPEELKYGERALILNEKLAFDLFRSDPALDHFVSVNGVEYRVVGVVRDPMGVGDLEECAFFVPLAQIAREEVELTALTLSGRPIKGFGASVALPDIAGRWQPGGDTYILRREAMYGTLLARALAFFVGMGIVLKLIRRVTRATGGVIRRYAERLRLEYARDMLWMLILKLVGVAAGYAALFACAYVLIGFMVDPVYVFPDWVPGVLVDPREISLKFWSVQIGVSGVREFRSPEVLRLRFFGTVSNVGVVVALLGALAHAYGKRGGETR